MDYRVRPNCAAVPGKCPQESSKCPIREEVTVVFGAGHEPLTNALRQDIVVHLKLAP